LSTKPWAGNIAQWYSTFLTCPRPSVPSPAPPKQNYKAPLREVLQVKLYAKNKFIFYLHILYSIIRLYIKLYYITCIIQN
jgi:hypothetical protein